MALSAAALALVGVLFVKAKALMQRVFTILSVVLFAGMQAHIAKPLDVDRMMATIRDVLSKNAAGR